MGNPVLAVENFFSLTQFPNHVVTGTEEPVGFEAAKIANGRRSILDYWTMITANLQAYLTAVCDRVRSANFVAIDRGHNLAGKRVIVECSNDNFTTVETALDVILPTVSATGSLDDGLGVRTEEGAWLARFPLRSAKYWRLNIPAMGASQKPKIVGLMLGLSWEAQYFAMPWSVDAHDLVRQTNESGAGWRGSSAGTRRRQFVIKLKLVDYISYDQARYHVDGHFGAGRPMWIIHDSAQAERAVQAELDGKVEFLRATDWGFMQCNLPWIEHESMLAA